MGNTVVCKGCRGVNVLYTQNIYYSNIHLYNVCFSFLVAFMLVKKMFLNEAIKSRGTCILDWSEYNKITALISEKYFELKRILCVVIEQAWH